LIDVYLDKGEIEVEEEEIVTPVEVVDETPVI
jgi:hypothetical protein